MLRSLVVALAALVLVGQGRDRPAAFEQVSGDRTDTLDQLFADGAPVARWAQLRERSFTTHGPVSEL